MYVFHNFHVTCFKFKCMKPLIFIWTFWLPRLTSIFRVYERKGYCSVAKLCQWLGAGSMIFAISKWTRFIWYVTHQHAIFSWVLSENNKGNVILEQDQRSWPRVLLKDITGSWYLCSCGRDWQNIPRSTSKSQKWTQWIQTPLRLNSSQLFISDKNTEYLDFTFKWGEISHPWGISDFKVQLWVWGGQLADRASKQNLFLQNGVTRIAYVLINFSCCHILTALIIHAFDLTPNERPRVKRVVHILLLWRL